jgi:hypothetical protein
MALLNTLPGPTQLNDGCMLACIANAMNLYRIPTSQYEAFGKCNPTSGGGVTNEEAARGLRRYGFRPLIKKWYSQDDHERAYKWLQRQTQNGKFVIIGINGFTDPGYHAILAICADKSKVTIWNPDDANPKSVLKSNLFKVWWNWRQPEGETIRPHIDLIGMSPRTQITKRAVEIQCHLVNPHDGVLNSVG